MKHLLLLITTLCSLPLSGAYWIVGGHEAKPHSRPYMASLQYKNDHFCGGALIKSKWVLTAAHCMDDLSANSIRVVLGAHKFSAPDKYLQVFSVLNSIKHPNYSMSTYENDILLLKLNDSAVVSTGVKPIALPRKSSKVKPGTPCSVAGWGYVSDSHLKPKSLMETDVDIISQKYCRNFWPDIFQSMVCSATPGKIKGFCSGDSGGPLVCKDRLEGLVSFSGKHCGNPLTPDVYTRVSYFLPWIQEVIKGEIQST
ncbi:serine protease 57-like [Spea bombifrons]|uniref:serine protease 57-like n=1 Tax=Spea bombifrons TaxID=233779 RepID=UPI00234BA86C|nr:serine protease 57-like [Spea bombifrons]